MISIPLLLSNEHPCSYLEDRVAQSLFVHPHFPLQSAIYADLLAHGFRRSGNDVYRPDCPTCNACIPARIAVAQFQPNRSQQRCKKKHSHTRVILKPAIFEQAHYELYLRYQKSRHADGNMAHSTPEDYLNFLASHWCPTRFVEFFIEDKLAAVAVVDEFDNALSAVYTFFDPDLPQFSLGVYAVLWQIDYAKAHNKEFVYLGYWIEQCPKMSYKSQYQPLQLRVNNQWT